MSELVAVPTEPTALQGATRPGRGRAAVRQAWVERLVRFHASGLRPGPFCDQEGVSLPAFYAWKRRLATEASARPAEHGSAAGPGPRLLPVRLPPPAAALELVLPQGAVLRIPPGCDLAHVRALVEALGGAPC